MFKKGGYCLLKEKTEFELSERKKELLLNAVEGYIENALPITSEKVHTNLFQNLSPATLRNELSNLEEMGFLKQLHTSSGRIPTTKAYRYFVNHIMLNSDIDMNSVQEIKNKFINRSAFLGDILDGIAKSISEITQYPTFVHMSGFNELEIQGINIIKLITGQALVLFQTNAGIINSTIELNHEVSEENCKDASKFLTTNLYGKKIKEIIENISYYNALFKNQIKFYQELFIALTNVLKEYAESGQSKMGNTSTTKLLNNPEYQDLDNAKKFLNLIENEKEIKNIMDNIDQNSDQELVFTIGDENNNESLNEYSIVKANYTMNNGIVTSIGVVGPQRLDYARIASALKYITDELKKR